MSFLRRLAFVLSASIAGGYAVDYGLGDKHATNETYCAIREFIKPDSRVERATLKLAVASEPLTPKEQKTLESALADAKERYSKEFGIDLVVTETLGVKPYGDTLNIFGAASDVKHLTTRSSDARLLLVHRDYTIQDGNWAGITNPGKAFTIIDEIGRRGAKELSWILQHEIGHLYYCGHEGDPRCMMFPSQVPENELPPGGPVWCGRAKETILRHKHRLW